MRLRKEHGHTQDELSEMIGFSKIHLSGIECGKYTATKPFIFRLCTVRGRTPDYFLIGQVSSVTDDLTNLLHRLTEEEQEIVMKMIKLYLDSRK